MAFGAVKVQLCVFFVAVCAKEVFEIENKLLDLSPLDEEELTLNGTSSGNATDTLVPDAYSTLKLVNREVLTVKGIELPDCTKGCTKHLFNTMDVAVKSGNNFERFKNVCHRFAETCDCLDKLKHCSSFELFYVFTSGLKYMCIEQERAFSALIDCIDVHASEIKEGCSRDCGLERVLAGWALYSALRGTPLVSFRMGKVPSRVNVVFFRKIMTEGCGLVECYLSCLRTKYNARCYGTAGSLLSEVLLRPVAETHDSVILEPWTNLFKLVLPVQCNFFTTKSGLSLYRIDKKLEDDLKAVFESNGTTLRNFKYFVGSQEPRQHYLKPKNEEEPWRPVGDEASHSPLEDEHLDRMSEWRSGGESVAPDEIDKSVVDEGKSDSFNGNFARHISSESGRKQFSLGLWDALSTIFATSERLDVSAAKKAEN